jgi:hypothetical protein
MPTFASGKKALNRLKLVGSRGRRLMLQGESAGGKSRRSPEFIMLQIHYDYVAFSALCQVKTCELE